MAKIREGWETREWKECDHDLGLYRRLALRLGRLGGAIRKSDQYRYTGKAYPGRCTCGAYQKVVYPLTYYCYSNVNDYGTVLLTTRRKRYCMGEVLHLL